MKKLIVFVLVLGLCGTVQAALVSQWKFDDDLTDSAGSNDGSPIGGPLIYTTGKIGKAIDFNGSGQGVTVPHHSSLRPPYITISAWIRQEVYTIKWQCIVRKEDGDNRYLLEVGEEGPVNGIYCGFGTDGTHYEERGAAVDTAVLTDGNWHHAATTYDGSYMKIYFDGEEIGSWNDFVPGPLSTSGSSEVGIGRYGGGEYFNGGIDDVRIYSRALTEVEIADLAGAVTPTAHSPEPSNDATGVSRAPTLSWTPGDYAETHDVYFSTDESKVTKGTITPVNRSTPTYTPGLLEYGTTYYWRVDEVNDACDASPWQGYVWHFTTTSTPKAYDPDPDGTKLVGINQILSWTAAAGGIFTHNVYFGTDENGLVLVSEQQAETTYNPDLEWGRTYFWRIDEVEDGTPYTGDVWSFTVTTTRPMPYIKGDLNADLAVNFDDLMILTEYWLQEIEYVDANCPDLDYSGVVDMCDFTLMAINWLQKAGPLVINEFMASNRDTLEDGDGNSSDWIELHNISNETINLEGWYLTDDAEDLTKWRFPSGATVDGGSYLVVFASGKEVNDYVDPSGYYHTNFKLSALGEYLALVDPNGEKIVHEYISAVLDIGENLFGYPRQETDISYGLYENAERYFGVPTPGAENDNPFIGFVADTKFDPDRGFYETPFDVAITSDTRGATIYYTTDGSEPNESSTQYTGPVPISTTTCLRAKAYKPNWMPTNVDTHTYIFPADVIEQPGNPAGFPSSWNGTAPDYEMASDVVDAYSDTIIDDLKTIPTISIVTSVEDMFGSSGIYANPTGEGFAWERPCSLELINPDGSKGFQVNCGLRIHGGGGRGEDYKKHGFRALFKSMYGPSKLRYKLFPDTNVDSFDTIVFKCGTDVVWIDGRWYNVRGLYVRDQWCHDTERDMGALTTHGRFVHLYVNGLYWGLYNAMERPDASFMAHYLGGDKENYDSINQSEVIDGDRQAWDAAIALANSGGSRGYDNAWYEEMQQWVDIDNICDYILNQFYNGNIDWPGGNGNNWRVASVRIRDAGGNPIGASFKSFTWDAEHTLADGHVSSDAYWDAIAGFNNRDGLPSRFFGTLRYNAEFVMRFADRAHKYLFNDGALTIAEATERFNIRCNEIDRAIVGESARWGDKCVSPSRTRADWAAERDRLLSIYFPNRTGVFIGHLKNHDFYPNIDAPVFNPHGGHVPVGFNLTMSAPDTIYYTMDGNDPRLPGGSINPDAATYGPAIPLNETTHVKARAKDGSTWSALNEAVFAVGPVKENLRITEIMYHPQETGEPNDPNEEFIELKNIGPDPINLNLISFTEGIHFTFQNIQLDVNEFVIVVRDKDAFNAHYPAFSGVIAGVYTGNLDNAGERIRLEDAVGETIHDFKYRDGWYDITDGGGFSLTVKDPSNTDSNQWSEKSTWRPSAKAGGSPGWDDTGDVPELGSVKINELLAHSSGITSDWIELHNTTSKPINIGGWFLSDNDNNFMKYEITENTIIDPLGYIVFREDQHFDNPGDPGCHTPFAFSKNGETAYLHSGQGGVLTGYSEEEKFGASETGVAFGRYLKSTGTYNFVAMSENTPGYRIPPYENAYPKVGPIVINEIMYHPEPQGDAEYVELINIDSSPVPLQEYDPCEAIYVPWRFTDSDGSITFDFPLGVTMDPGERVLLVKNEVIFDDQFPGVLGSGVQIFEWGSGKLNNGGEKIQLSKPGDEVGGTRYYIRVDRVVYSDGEHPLGDDPWPREPDGFGSSLVRKVPSEYGNDVINWQATDPPTPGTDNPAT